MKTQTRMAWGSFRATLGALGMVVSPLLGWTAAPRPWGFLSGLAAGLSAGLAAALCAAGLIKRRRGKVGA